MKLRVGVLFGGRSGEHAISLRSARSIISALDPERYEVVPVGITREGRWMMPEDAIRALEDGVEKAKGGRVALLAEGLDGRLASIESLLKPGTCSGDSAFTRPLDVIFPVLHGTYGEDGTLQGLLEMADVAYVGAGVAGSAVGMDKLLMKAVFASRGFPQAPFEGFARAHWQMGPEAIEHRIEDILGYPCFVKPANLGSSVGISKAHNRAELHAAIETACRYDRRIVVEKAVPHVRELETAVLGNDDPQVSVVGEVVPSNEFYDYEAKYIKDDSTLVIPAEIPESIADKVRRLACEAFLALDLAGLSRVDFLYDNLANELFINEVNTMPGFTSISMYPKLWEASGIPYPALLDRLIELALERRKDKAQTQFVFHPGHG